MRIPEPRPFGETSLRAIVLAIWAADPLKVRGGGWVESVVTRLTQRFVERFFAIRSRVQRQLKCVAVVLIDLGRLSRVLIRFVLCQVVANVVEILVDVREALLFDLGAGLHFGCAVVRMFIVHGRSPRAQPCAIRTRLLATDVPSRTREFPEGTRQSAKLNRTDTVITTSTGSPFSNVESNRHWRTASTAAIANSGCTCALTTRTETTVPSRPMTASIGTTPSLPASRIVCG